MEQGSVRVVFSSRVGLFPGGVSGSDDWALPRCRAGGNKQPLGARMWSTIKSDGGGLRNGRPLRFARGRTVGESTKPRKKRRKCGKPQPPPRQGCRGCLWCLSDLHAGDCADIRSVGAPSNQRTRRLQPSVAEPAFFLGTAPLCAPTKRLPA